MEVTNAVQMIASLAHETRLALFRLLVRAGDDGVSAGAIGSALGVAPSTLSHHLSHLEHAGLIRSRRHSRHIVYAVVPDAVRGLVTYLTEDCCGGRPDLCGIAGAAASC